MSDLESHAPMKKGTREELPIFGTEETRAKAMAIYDDALHRWPVRYQTLLVPTRYGNTHVIASGDAASPPLVMTHPAAVGSFVWSSIVAPLSTRHRVYAVDTIGDFGGVSWQIRTGIQRKAATTAPGLKTCTKS